MTHAVTEAEYIAILSAKLVVRHNELERIIQPWYPESWTAERIATYKENARDSVPVRDLMDAFSNLKGSSIFCVLRLWKITILVYRETPTWLVSAHHGISCRREYAGSDRREVTHTAIWSQRFYSLLADIILQPLFCRHQNGAFFRLAIQFAVACRNQDGRVWDISGLLAQASINCPLLDALRDEMLTLMGPLVEEVPGHRIVLTDTSVNVRLGAVSRRLELSNSLDTSPSQEAIFLLRLGDEVKRAVFNDQGMMSTADTAQDNRCQFHLAKSDLDNVWSAAKQMELPNLWMKHGSKFVQIVAKRNIPQLMRDAYIHELLLLDAYRESIAASSRDTSQAEISNIAAPLPPHPDSASSALIPWNEVDPELLGELSWPEHDLIPDDLGQTGHDSPQSSSLQAQLLLGPSQNTVELIAAGSPQPSPPLPDQLLPTEALEPVEEGHGTCPSPTRPEPTENEEFPWNIYINGVRVDKLSDLRLTSWDRIRKARDSDD